MKRILCFGDSLTWGFNPATHSRYEEKERWTTQLEQLLGPGYKIIEEALCGRTTILTDPFEPMREANKVLPILLESHCPLDLVIILLGTNDLKYYLKTDAKQAALGCGQLINQIRSNVFCKNTKILLISPPRISKPSGIMEIIFGTSYPESTHFAQHYKTISQLLQVEFLDSSLIISASDIDGVHLSVESNTTLANHLSIRVNEIFKK